MLCAAWDVKLPGYFVTFDFAVKRGTIYSDRMNAVVVPRRFEIDLPWQLAAAKREIEAPPPYVGG